MADAHLAIEYVLEREGGFVDNAHDHGGATNFGISLRFIRSLPEERQRKYGFFGEIGVDQIREMTEQQAINIYQGEFWDVQPFHLIADQTFANYLFDACVNHGIAQGIKLAQRALWAVNREKGICLDDGILGEQTLSLINHSISCLLPTLMAERAGLMRLIVAQDPLEKEFLNGWLNRAYRA